MRLDVPGPIPLPTPFRALASRRPLRGATVGLATTMVALGAFYLMNALVLDLGTHSAIERIRLSFGVGYWFGPALLSGPVFGFCGASWRRSDYRSAGTAVLMLLVAEPLFWALAGRAGGVANFAFAPSRTVSVGEAALGLVASASLYGLLLRRRRRVTTQVESAGG
jgi:hypothetical protein